MAAAPECSTGQSLVHRSLSDFMTEHIPDASLEGIDDMLLSYMLGVLEDLGSDDGFEVESFIEMMQAYIPGFDDVESDIICDWIFKLAESVQNSKEKENTPPGAGSPCSSPVGDALARLSSPSEPRCTLTEVNLGQESADHHGDKTDDSTKDSEDDIQVRHLLEMFPASCSLEARRCLATAKGEMEDAVQLMLLEMEKNDGVPTVTKEEWSSGSRKSKNDEKKIRDSVLQKYGYVDVDADDVFHRPVAPKQDKKKMTRYLNSQVCSTKGERFVDTKKPMTEEMKKTYINLKPARSYHFH